MIIIILSHRNNIIVSILYCLSLSTVVHVQCTIQGLVYTSFPFMGIINYIWPLDQPSRTAVPSVSKTNLHHWFSLSWRMLLVAQVSLTTLLNQLLSWDMWLCPISIFLTRDYDGDKRALCCLYLPRCLLSFRKEKKKTRKNQHINQRNRDENKSSE